VAISAEKASSSTINHESLNRRVWVKNPWMKRGNPLMSFPEESGFSAVENE